MSREHIDGVDWVLVAGVDHVTSSFLEVWRQPYDEQDQPVLMVNNRGINVYDDNLPPQVQRAVMVIQKCFALSRQGGIPYPNITDEHANHLARAFGFPEMLGRFKRIFD